MRYKQIHAAKMKAARRRLRLKRARWGEATIIRGSGKGGGSQCTAPQRSYMTASAMKRKHG